MRSFHGWAGLGLLALAGLLAGTSESIAQAYGQQFPLAQKPQPANQWHFDGNQWQFQENGNGTVTPPGQFPTIPNGSGPQFPPNGGPGFPPANGAPYYPPNYFPNGQGQTSVNIQPQFPFQQPPPASAQLSIVTPRFSLSIGGGPLAMQTPHWLVTYRRHPYEPWQFFGCYGSSAQAFAAANALSNQGFFAGVTCKH